MRPTPSHSRVLSCALAASAAALALAPIASAHAATTTWKVANPAADGRFTATTTGGFTARNSAGQAVVTCASVYQQGAMPDLTSTAATPTLAIADLTASYVNSATCTGPKGKVGVLVGGPTNGAKFYYTPTGYNATTGTTSLVGNRSAAYALTFLADDCRFEFSKISASYTNSTRTLKFTSGTAIPFTAANNDGSIGCSGVANNATLTITADLKLDQAVTVTRTTT